MMRRVCAPAKIVSVPAAHPDAMELMIELNAVLAQLTGDDGAASFEMDSLDAQTGRFLLAYHENQPVACGSIRWHDNVSCEIKRMYSRKKGFGGALLRALMVEARDLGYRRAVLSTRKINVQAVNFYQSHGFIEISPYGKYTETNLSVCMGKVLIQGYTEGAGQLE